jgi:hypothetical protein
MANKQTNELVELTSLASNDLVLVYDVSEPGSEKIKKMESEDFFSDIQSQITNVSGSLASQINTSNSMFSYNAGTNEITFKGHLIPDTDDVWNIGRSDKKIAELFVSASTIHVGDSATFSGTSLAITGGPSPTSLGQNPTMQASTLILQPFTYNPGAGNVSVDPKLTFINGSGQSYGISFNVADNDFSFDAPSGAAKGNIKTNKLTADTIETTGTTQILFKQSVRTDGDVTLGYDENNDIIIKGAVDLRTPITFGYAATLGDGNDNITVNCGGANRFVVTSQYFNVDTNGAITASGISTTGNSEVGGNLNVTGNLSVQGDTFTVNTQTVTAEDNLIIINSLEAGAGVTAGTAGIEVERGTETNYQFLFDETQDNFRVGVAGALQAVATRQDTPTSSGVGFWNGSAYRVDTDANLTFSASVLSSPYLKATGTTKTAAALYAGSTDPDGSTRLNYDGYFYATRVYNAYLNDVADFQMVIGEQIPGKCYYDTLDGAMICNERCQKSTIGILSDTFGIAAGAQNDPNYGPFAIAGWVLAYVDVEESDIIEPGDALTSNSTGNLIRMTQAEKQEFPERIMAIYKKPETAEFWGPNNDIVVNGRHWVKVR